MLEGIRGVLVALTKEFGSDETSSATGYGLTLARAAGAHLTVQAASQRLHVRNADLSGTLRGLVGGANARLRELARAAAEQAGEAAAEAGVAATVHAPHLGYPDLLACFTALGHVHDLSVVDAEPAPIHPDRDLIQALLVRSGRPLVVVPSGWEEFRARRVIIAWDGSGRAARAAHDALPFLRAAEAVRVLSVTGEKALPAQASGADLAAHLQRHGVPAEVEAIAALHGDVAEALREEALRASAEMIVMGGYVHSPLRELLFGGVTQSLLRSSPVPLLMSY